MKTAKCQFQIKRGVVEMDDLEDDDKAFAEACLEHVRNGESEQAVTKLMARMNFEWAWNNCDGDPAAVCADAKNFTIDLTTANTPQLLVGERHGALMLTVTVDFELPVNDDVDEEALTSWLDENSASLCALVSGGWSYSGSAGENVWVQSV